MVVACSSTSAGDLVGCEGAGGAGGSSFGAVEAGQSSFLTTGGLSLRNGGAAKAGIACLIETGGAIRTGGTRVTCCGGSFDGCGRGGAEYTGIAVLIVTGGAIPRQDALNCWTGI